MSRASHNRITSKPLRILFLTVRADFGGGPEHLWQLLRHCPSHVQAYVACPQDYPYYEKYASLIGEQNIFVLPHRTFSLRKFVKLWQFCRKKRISVLHSHGKGAGLYSRLMAAVTALPCVHTFHGVHMGVYSQSKKALYCLLERMLSLVTRIGIAVSQGEAEQIVAAKLMPARKLRIIENGVTIPEFSDEVHEPPYSIISISRFDIQKNSEFIIDILFALRDQKRLEEFCFIVVGIGSSKSHIESLAKQNGFEHNLHCVGATLEPARYFRGALAYLSTSRWEGMPLAVLEAMAHGLPTVVTDVVGNRDVVENEKTGFLYQEGDAMAAAQSLCRLVDFPDMQNKIAKNAHNYVREKHDISVMSANTYAILESLC
jgi:glycosyltransferase involved in cell wall biosynthesis